MNRITAAGTAASHVESDAALASRLVAGDQRALGVLYDRHAAAAYALACAISGRPTVAESVIADAFARVWREASTFDPQRMSLLAWLMSIVRALALKERASDASVPRILVRESAAPLDASASGLESVERSRSVGGLDALQARAVELAYFGGRSRADIGRELQLTEGEVTQLLRSAIAALRGTLTPQVSSHGQSPAVELTGHPSSNSSSAAATSSSAMVTGVAREAVTP